MKQMIIKPGSIWLFKKYSIWKRALAFITRKQLPYNAWVVIDTDLQVLTRNIKKSNYYVIVEPKKKYSAKELNKLVQFRIQDEEYTDKDLFTIINAIRPNTLNPNGELEQLLYSKFYNVRDMSNEEEYTEYIYHTK